MGFFNKICIVLYCTILYHIIIYCTILYHIILYYIVLYCIGFLPSILMFHDDEDNKSIQMGKSAMI